MKVHEELIEKLREETNADYGFCERVLIRYNNNYEKAKIYILTYNDKFFTRMYKNVASVFTGDRSFRLRINDDEGEIIFDIPLVILIIICIVIPVSSVIIAMFLMLIILLSCSLHIEINNVKHDILGPDTEEEDESLNMHEISHAEYEFDKKGNSFIACKQKIESTENHILNTQEKTKYSQTASIGHLGNEPIITKTDDDYYILTIK